MDNNKSLYYNRTLYLKEFSKELTMVLPAQELKAAPPFSPILTQYGLNANEFCEKFNKETKIFPTGSLIPTSIFYRPKEKKFDFCFRPFQLKHILQQYIKYDEIQRFYLIDYIDLYKALIIKGDILNDKDLKRVFRNIKGTLKSYDRPVMIKIAGKTLRANNIDLEEEEDEKITGEYPIELDTEEQEENTDQEDQEEIFSEEKKINDLANIYYDEFSIKRVKIYKNKRRLAEIVKKRKKRRAFDIWYKIPYSILIYTPKIRFYHLMKNYLYKLNDCILIRKQRFFYKKDYSKKDLTSFFTYRIYSHDFYKLYESLEEIAEYDVQILGIEIHNKVYPVEQIPNFFKNIKEDLKFIFNIFTDWNKELTEITSDYNKIDKEYQQNIIELLQLCQHTIK